MIGRMKIEFSDDFRWQPEWISFGAVVDGASTDVRISRNALDDRFGAEANQNSEQSAFKLNRDAIREIAHRMFVAGAREQDGSVVITSDAVIRYDPTLVR